MWHDTLVHSYRKVFLKLIVRIIPFLRDPETSIHEKQSWRQWCTTHLLELFESHHNSVPWTHFLWQFLETLTAPNLQPLTISNLYRMIFITICSSSSSFLNSQMKKMGVSFCCFNFRRFSNVVVLVCFSGVGKTINKCCWVFLIIKDPFPNILVYPTLLLIELTSNSPYDLMTETLSFMTS